MGNIYTAEKDQLIHRERGFQGNIVSKLKSVWRYSDAFLFMFIPCLKEDFISGILLLRQNLTNLLAYFREEYNGDKRNWK